MTEVGPCGHGVEHLRTRRSGRIECIRCKRARERRRTLTVEPEENPVVFASAAALRYAETHGVARPLENLVRACLVEGRFRADRRGGVTVAVADGLVAVAVKQARGSGRDSWLVTAVRRAAA